MKHDWEYKKLAEVCDVLYGCPFDSSLFTENTDCMPLIRIRDIKNSFTETFYKGTYSNEYVITKGDFLVGMDGEFNVCEWKGIDALLNQRVCKISSKNENFLNRRFLYWSLPLQLKQIEDLTPFVTVKHLSAKKIANIKIPQIPLKSQILIAEELDTLSGIITDCKETLKDYDALEQSIFYDMFGDPVKNEKGWEVKKLGEVAFAQNGLVSPTEEPYCEMIHVGPANIVSGTGELINLKTAKDENLISGKYLFDKDMILYSKIRPNLNKLTSAKFQGLCSADMYPIICGELLNPYYLASVLRHKRFLSYAIENSGRANIPKINREALFQFEMHLPPLPLQQAFASKIEAIEQMKEETKKALQEAETLFQARMDYWFN